MRKRKGYKNSRLRSKRLQRFAKANLTRRVLRDDMFKAKRLTRPIRTYKKIKLINRSINILNKNSNINTVKKPGRLAKIHYTSGKLLDKKIICKDRRDRRRALFRMGRAGSGVSGPAKKWMTNKSRIRCK